MTDWTAEVSRRRFLGGLAVLGATPFCQRLDALAWQPGPRQFSGDNLERAHKLLFNPAEAIAAAGPPEDHQAMHDVLIVGSGIAGLTVAYQLRDRRILLLESGAEIGGVSKSEMWQGIQYAIGAAYIIDPAPESEDAREVAGFKLLEELGLRVRGESLTGSGVQRRLSSDANHVVFSNRRVIPESEVYTARNRLFFEHVLDSDNYPSVPPSDPALVEALDRISFRQFLSNAALQRKLYGRTTGVVSRLGWEAIEYYCWGAFGTAAAETSAYHGLNFFAAEFGSVLVYPGGNAFIAKRLGERIRQANPQAIKTGTWTLQIERGDGAWSAIVWDDGRLHRHRARNIVFAAPLFLAARIIPSLPEPQRKAIESLEYRSYVVANVLLRRPANRMFAHRAFRNGYELTRVHGMDVGTLPAKQISDRKVYSDAILADFASGRHATHAVLTVYRPYPYDAGRAELADRSYDEMESEIRRELLAGFGPHGLRAQDIEEIRIARWGHPMIVTRPGQLADGTLKSAAQPQAGLYFAHTDVNGAPAYENALAAAFDAVAALHARS